MDKDESTSKLLQNQICLSCSSMALGKASAAGTICQIRHPLLNCTHMGARGHDVVLSAPPAPCLNHASGVRAPEVCTACLLWAASGAEALCPCSDAPVLPAEPVGRDVLVAAAPQGCLRLPISLGRCLYCILQVQEC